MLKQQKEVLQHQLDAERAVIKELERQYRLALEDVNMVISMLLTDEQTPSKINRIAYQERLRTQLEGILEGLHINEYKTINKYLKKSYTDAFVGTMYDMHKQGIPLVIPIDQNAAVKAIQLDTKLTERKAYKNPNDPDGEHVTLYESLGVDVSKLKTTIRHEITRGIASGMETKDIARNISEVARIPLNRAKTIARTEAHRIQQASSEDARQEAKAKGADVVKQWDATLDGSVRSSHRALDGQIREVEEPFQYGNKTAMYPGDFGIAAEDCNCRCIALTRARAALDEEELEQLKKRAEHFELDKAQDFKDFEKKYLKAAEEEAKAEAETKETRKAETMAEINGRATEALLNAYDDRREHFGLRLTPADALRGAAINPVTADYTGLSPETAKAFDDTIQRLSDEYYTGFTRIEVADPKKMLGVTDFATTHHQNTVAQKTLEINPVKTKDYDKMVARVKELAQKGYAVKVVEGKEGEYIATHEFAHSLFDIGGGSLKNYVGMDTKQVTKDRKTITAIYTKYKQDVEDHERIYKSLEMKAMMADDMQDAEVYMKEAREAKKKLDRIKISGYSMQNADEFMAEAFTQSKIGATVSPYADEVIAVLDKTYKKPAKAAKPLINQGDGGIMEVELDGMVPCLQDAKTGEYLDTTVRKITSRRALKQYNEKNGWYINWNEVPSDCTVCALTLKGDTTTQGLVAYKMDHANKAVFGHWIVSAPHNRGKDKKYSGVGGHLFAVMADASLQAGYGGYVFGKASSMAVLEYYYNEFKAIPIGGFRFIINEQAAKLILSKYTFEREDE